MVRVRGHGASTRPWCEYAAMVRVRGHGASTRPWCEYAAMVRLRGHDASTRAGRHEAASSTRGATTEGRAPRGGTIDRRPRELDTSGFDGVPRALERPRFNARPPSSADESLNNREQRQRIVWLQWRYLVTYVTYQSQLRTSTVAPQPVLVGPVRPLCTSIDVHARRVPEVVPRHSGGRHSRGRVRAACIALQVVAAIAWRSKHQQRMASRCYSHWFSSSQYSRSA